MTKQPKTARRNHGRGHSYLLDGEKVPGVTTIIDGGVPKRALIKWAAETTAAHAVDHWGELAELTPSERLKRLESAHRKVKSAAAVRGSDVHRLAERLVRGEEVDVPDEIAGHVEAYVQFLDEWQVKPILVEAPVFSRRWRYGGTLDLVADLADGTRCLIDIKTSGSGIWTEVCLQCSAYRYADIYLDEHGQERPMLPVDEARALWVRADGYDLYPIEATPEYLRYFAYVAQVHQFTQIKREDVIGDALRPPTEAV